MSVVANTSLVVKVGRSEVLCGVNSLIEGWQLETSLACSWKLMIVASRVMYESSAFPT
jgi:hypothetical protein